MSDGCLHAIGGPHASDEASGGAAWKMASESAIWPPEIGADPVHCAKRRNLIPPEMACQSLLKGPGQSGRNGLEHISRESKITSCASLGDRS
eukprot:6191468-Pleurochrysis_carterae.AAC.3